MTLHDRNYANTYKQQSASARGGYILFIYLLLLMNTNDTRARAHAHETHACNILKCERKYIRVFTFLLN